MIKDNKKMIALLAILIALFFVVRWMKADKDVRNFNSELFSLDTALVNSISLFPKAGKHEEIKFTKANGSWTVAKGKVTSRVSNNQISVLLSALLDVKPKRLAARTEEKWDKYEVSDSLGTRVVLKGQAGKSMVDLVIGKFSYKQGPAQPGMGGQPNISGLTYVRNTGEEETYATEGFLSMSFNRDFNSFRDKALVACKPENIKNLNFKSPLGAFTLQKIGNDWMLGGTKADSVLVSNYVNQLGNINATKIDDNFSAASNDGYSCTISGDNMEAINLKAFAKNGVFKLQSSLNPSVTFESDSSGVFSRIFKQEMDFVEGE